MFTIVKDRSDPKSASIGALSLTSGAHTTVLDGAMDARYVSTGHLLYVRLGRLEAVPFDPVRKVATGEAAVLVPDVMQALNAGSEYINTGAAQLTVSGTGTLVYVTGGMVPDLRAELVWVDRRGAIVGALRIPPGPYSAPRVSPDGRRIPYSDLGFNWSLRYYDLDREASTAIPTPGKPWCPVWLPDGKRAIFATSAGGPYEYPGSWTVTMCNR